MHRKRRSARLRTQFGGAEYAGAVQKGGMRKPDLRSAHSRPRGLHVRPLAASARGSFADGPAGAVAEVDQLLNDVMSTRGYPVSDFEQRAADRAWFR